MAYDVLGRMTSRTEADLVSNWTYDTCTKGVGKLCQVTADNGYARSVTYDALGRVSSLATSIDASYTVAYSYDAASRLDVTTYPTGFAVQNVYTATGYLQKVQRTNDPDSTVFWQATSRNAAGQVTNEALGNALTTTRSYDTLFRLGAVQSAGAGGAVHDLAYTYDALGNVTQRIDNVQAVAENFAYDSLNRLLASSGPALATHAWDYDAIGNLTYKSDIGVYTYGTKPHAVASVGNSGAPNSITASYAYDANGSLTAASGTLYPASGSLAFSRTLAYTSYNLPASIAQTQGANSYSYTYTYSAGHERVKLVTVRPDDTLTSIYLHPGGKGALLYEKETRASDGRIEHKHYVTGGAGLVGVYVTKSAYGPGEGPEMRYYHTDHLGSIAVITNPSGAVIERLAYEAFGERRSPSGTPQDRAGPLIGITTDRGFTAHEHLDEMMLIHMNGRIYDPVLGRFMTADPFVQAPTNLQSYNRYSYGFNNPLSGVDPSGYGFFSDLFEIAVVVFVAIVAPEFISEAFVSSAVSSGAYLGFDLATAAAIGNQAAILGGVVGGFGTAFISSGGNFETGLLGAISGGLFGLAGTIGENPLGAERLFAHAVAGCVQGELMGGGCSRGAVSAVAGKVATGLTNGNPVAAVVAGGTVSVIGGGKFGNGAVTAAFGYLFNCLAHECLAQGRDAEATFRNYLDASGKTTELGLDFNKFYDSQNTPFFGFPDIFSESLGMVWDVKPDSIYGWSSGAAQMGMYTANGVYSAGAGAPLFGSQSSVTLTGSMNRYEFGYGGGGLVIYRALDASPMERSLGRAFQNQAAPTLFGPPGRRSVLFE
jgi:RHS repeat-associated protein